MAAFPALPEMPRQLVKLTSCGWFRAFPIPLHIALGTCQRKYLLPWHRMPNQGLMQELRAGNLPSACHEKFFSYLRNALNPINPLPSPDSAKTIGVRVHFAFRWKLETASRDYDVSENGFLQDGEVWAMSGTAIKPLQRQTPSMRSGRRSTLPTPLVSDISAIRPSCEICACPFPPPC